MKLSPYGEGKEETGAGVKVLPGAASSAKLPTVATALDETQDTQQPPQTKPHCSSGAAQRWPVLHGHFLEVGFPRWMLRAAEPHFASSLLSSLHWGLVYFLEGVGVSFANVILCFHL